MDTIVQRVLLAVAVVCGAVAVWDESLPAAVVTGGVLLAWAIYSAALLAGEARRG